MKISAGPSLVTPTDSPSAPAKPVVNERLSSPTAAPATLDANGGTGSNAAAKPSEPLTDVTVRRDNNGRVYYVVSDANSGQEILEVPPKALRDVSQGIADYLKEEQSKVSAHVKVTV